MKDVEGMVDVMVVVDVVMVIGVVVVEVVGVEWVVERLHVEVVFMPILNNGMNMSKCFYR